MKIEREILFGGYNYKGHWVEGFACRDGDNGELLIIGPYMSEDTDAWSVNHVYQYTGINFDGKRIFEGCRIVGGYQWMEKDGIAMSREIDDTVVWRRGGWVLESTAENLFELMDNDSLYWDASVIPPRNY